MQLHISGNNLELPRATRLTVDRKVRLALGRLTSGIARADVSLSATADGLGKRCRIRVRMRERGGGSEAVEDARESLHEAVAAAAWRLARRLERRRANEPAAASRRPALRTLASGRRVLRNAAGALGLVALLVPAGATASTGGGPAPAPPSAAPALADAVIEREVRLLIKGDGRFLDTSLALEVEAGVVRVRGLFEDPADVSSLERRIASLPGVRAVEIDARLVAQMEQSARDV